MLPCLSNTDYVHATIFHLELIFHVRLYKSSTNYAYFQNTICLRTLYRCMYGSLYWLGVIGGDQTVEVKVQKLHMSVFNCLHIKCPFQRHRFRSLYLRQDYFQSFKFSLCDILYVCYVLQLCFLGVIIKFKEQNSQNDLKRQFTVYQFRSLDYVCINSFTIEVPHL